MGRHLTDHMLIMTNAGGADITGQPIGFGGRAGSEIGGEEGVQAGRRIIGYFFEADAAGTEPTILHFDGTDDEDFALTAAPAPADERIVLAAAGNLGLVDLDKTRQRAPTGGPHAAAQLGAEQPSRLVRAERELALQLQGRDAIGMGR